MQATDSAAPVPATPPSNGRQRLGDIGFIGFIALCVLVAWLSVHYHGGRLEEEALAARQQVAALDAQHLESHLALTLRGIDLTLQALLENGPPAEAGHTWNGLLGEALRHSPQLRSLSLLGPDGRIIASSNPANIGHRPGLGGYQPDGSGAAPLLRIGPPQAGRDLIDGAAMDPAAALPPLYFVPVLRGTGRTDERSLAMLAAINMDYFLNNGALPERAPTDHLEILSFDGQRLLDDNAPFDLDLHQANRTLAARWQAGDENGQVSEILRDKRYEAVYRVTHHFPLGVVARFDTDAALAGARAERSRQETRLFPTVALGLGGALLGYIFFRRAGSRERAARQAAEDALRASEARYRTTMDAVRDGMWEWNAQTGTMRWDRRCFEMLGYPPGAFEVDFPTCLAMLHPDDAPLVSGQLADQTSKAEGFSNEFRMRTATGDWHWVEGRGRVVEWQDGKPLRVVGTNSDIHARKTGEQRLRLLEAALNAAANAVVITNPQAVIEWVNPAFAALTGYAESEVIGRTPRELINSGTQSGEYYAALWNTILAGDVWRGELVNRRSDGRLYHEALTITPIHDDHGALDHFIAVKEDISARKAAETALDAAHARLRAVVDNFPGAVILEAPDGTITLVNQALCDLLGLQQCATELIGTPSADLADAVSRNFVEADAFISRIRTLREHARPVQGEEIEQVGGRWLERDFVPVHAGDTLLGFLRLYRDVTERKHHEQALQRMATLDGLTGAWNRRAFLERAEQERLRHLRTRHPTTLVMLDLDYFKRINDTWGHAAGDAVLCDFVRQVQSGLRSTDMLGRLGGEEFALLLADTGLDGAADLTERLRASIAANPIEYAGQHIGITVSAGIAPFRATDRSVEAALGRADEALYRAKSAGRNRFESAADDGDACDQACSA
ncbi:hypothetical protein CJ010_03360 [Azoarcus sp. DD4]|uniref:diguanylate cyclase n=1 Tax=Azoarcus sp. DD4 TaxID=2027405 RepID=UPI00112B5328|nr:diguanylate cyclase [Azoarcus sp. DD4]QDF95654.1 hypothetical protein CJ010_03360 [Azoarcus sp. DD4]